MSSWTGTSRINSDIIKRYIGPTCISDYSRYQDEFVREIATLNKSRYREFCNKCDKVKKNINEKDEELKRCYVNNLITVKLFQNANIKGFIEECPKIPECYKKYAPSAKKASVLKSGTTETCGRSDFKNERAQTLNGRSQLGIDTRTSNSANLQREGIVKESSSHARGEVTKQNKEGPQDQVGIKPPRYFGKDQVKESKQIDNHHSSRKVEEKKLSQPVSASETLSSGELGTQASHLPSQSSSSGESNSDNTTQVEHLSKGDIHVLHDGNHILDNNNPVGQAAASNIVKDQTADGRGDVSENSGRTSAGALPTVAYTAPSTAGYEVSVDVAKDGESPASKDIVTEESGSSVNVDEPPSDGSSHDRSTDCVCTDRKSNCDETHGEVAPCKKYLGVVPDGDNTANSLQRASDQNGQELSEIDASPPELVQITHLNVNQMLNHHTRLHTNRGTHDTDGADTYSLTSSKSLRPEGKEKEVELSTNNIDQDTSIINLITTYQKYIINAIVPLIFILLLILLMKYTPLRTIFTKKKRKKQNDMNEKLQRVLQQPSTESEQRRIPFSYSAFEYSP